MVPLIVYAATAADDPEGWAQLYAVASAPLGALAGALVGLGQTTWRRVWHRPNSAGEENP